MPIEWVSKHQKMVEAAIYRSEMVASRIAVEMIMSLRYYLYKLGLNLTPSSYLIGDIMAVVLSTAIPLSVLKKKHQACNYHKVRESIAARFIKYRHIKSKENLAASKIQFMQVLIIYTEIPA